MALLLLGLGCLLLTAPASSAVEAGSGAPASARGGGQGKAVRLSPSAGPLAGVRVKLSGAPVADLVSVSVGGRKATGLHRAGRKGWKVVLPTLDKPGTYRLTLRTKHGKVPSSASPRFTYLAPPRLSGLVPDTGVTTGGETVQIQGSDLAGGTVTVGGVPVTANATAQGLSFTTPPSPVGRAEVAVTTRGGEASATYVFVDPPDEETTDVVLGEDTETASGVQWVTGGSGVDGEDYADWVVSLAPDVDPPGPGTPYYLPPGGEVFPSGLAGTVSEVAGQVDGSTRITVSPSSLDEVLDEASVSYSGDVGDPVTAGRRGVSGDSDVSHTFDFGKIKAPNFLCQHSGGETATFSGSIGLRFDDVHITFDFDKGGLFSDPSLFAYVTAKPVIYGKVTADAKMTCRLGPAWANAQRKVVPLGSTGVTFSIGPRTYFQISAKGTLALEEHTRIMTGFATNSDGTLRPIGSAGADDPVVTASGDLTMEVKTGLGLQLGYLDRIGVYGAAELRAAAEVKATTDPYPQVCADLKAGFEFSLGAYLDLWVARWEFQGWSHDVSFVSWHGCAAPEDQADDEDPVITTTRLPNARLGDYYEERLETADDRNGRWTIASGHLPAGLSLDPDNGVVSGVPESGVGDHQVTFRFVDGAARTADAQVRIYVDPVEGLGGGDVQVRLRWHSDADLDLHVIDPDGEEIYWNNPYASSGGELDRDSNAACDEALADPVENIRWPSGTAPSGGYDAYVVVYDECGADDLDWDLQVSVDGRVVIDTTGSGDSIDYEFSVGYARASDGHRPGPTRGDLKS